MDGVVEDDGISLSETEISAWPASLQFLADPGFITEA
jgi:hypothetical protein